ncbi:MAG: hypothetical protein J0I94_05760 [Thiobacillus sp.]|nr:hypothetical protein [Thiobacillus sp.]
MSIVAGYCFAWLWHEWFFYALAMSAFLLLSGRLLLSNKNMTTQAMAIGVAIGAFIGSAIGLTHHF